MHRRGACAYVSFPGSVNPIRAVCILAYNRVVESTTTFRRIHAIDQSVIDHSVIDR